MGVGHAHTHKDASGMPQPVTMAQQDKIPSERHDGNPTDPSHQPEGGIQTGEDAGEPMEVDADQLGQGELDPGELSASETDSDDSTYERGANSEDEPLDPSWQSEDENEFRREEDEDEDEDL